MTIIFVFRFFAFVQLSEFSFISNSFQTVGTAKCRRAKKKVTILRTLAKYSKRFAVPHFVFHLSGRMGCRAYTRHFVAIFSPNLVSVLYFENSVQNTLKKEI